MSKVEQLIQELCPGGVEYKPLKEIGTLIRGNGLQKSDFIDFGYGCIHYGQIYTRFGMFTDKVLSYVSDELAQKLTKVEPGNVILACTSENVEDVCKSVVWLGNKTIVTGGHATVFRHNQNPKYIGYCLNTENFFNQKRKYAYGAKVIDIKIDKLGLIQIPLPPLPIQEEIVRILDTFTEAQVNLEQELELRKKQYEYYRNQLLTFDENDPSVKWMKLSDISTVYTGGELPKDCIFSEIKNDETPFAVYANGKDVYGYSNQYKINKDAVCISSIGANTGAVFYRKAFFTPIIRLKVLVPHDGIDTKFLFYAVGLIKVGSKNGGIPNINANDVKKIVIPVPPLARQQEIVTILDKFESAIQTLEEELALRKKQYEYYREKLLTFN